MAEATGTRRRGRPPADTHAVDTRDRLLKAAFDACLEHGFDGVVLADVAHRAGVTANAIYNHYASKHELLVATARWALEGLRLPDARPGRPVGDRARDVTLAFLAPEAAPTRRIIAELNLAGRRQPEVARLIAEWNADSLPRWLALAGPGPEADARIKALYLLLLGACMLEAVEYLPGDPTAVATTLADAAAGIFAARS